MAKTMEKPYHFFTTSWVNWTTDNDLLKCLESQKRRDKDAGVPVDKVAVWQVPGEASETKYSIDNYNPIIEGALYITTIKY